MNDKYIKLFIGLVLFVTLVALTILQTPHSERLVDMLYGALVGMGIMHVGGGPSDAASTAPDRQGGRALPGMLLTLACVAMLMLAACAAPGAVSDGEQSPPKQSVQVTITQACIAYGAGFDLALQMRRAGKLDKSQIDQVTMIASQVTPLCTGPLPADSTEATQKVVAAVAALAILESAKKE